MPDDGAAPLPPGALLHGRYLVGAALPAGADADAYVCAGFDTSCGRRVRLTARPMEPAMRGACLARAASLRTLAACNAIVAPLDAFEAGDRFLTVTALPLRTLADVPPDGAALTGVLRRLCDALLVLHSLGGTGAVHGAPSTASIWYFPAGIPGAPDVPCLYVPPVPQHGDAADDLRGFGAALLALLPASAGAPAELRALLERMRAGGYASVLEIRHELDWL